MRALRARHLSAYPLAVHSHRQGVPEARPCPSRARLGSVLHRSPPVYKFPFQHERSLTSARLEKSRSWIAFLAHNSPFDSVRRHRRSPRSPSGPLGGAAPPPASPGPPGAPQVLTPPLTASGCRGWCLCSRGRAGRQVARTSLLKRGGRWRMRMLRSLLLLRRRRSRRLPRLLVSRRWRAGSGRGPATSRRGGAASAPSLLASVAARPRRDVGRRGGRS